MPGMSLPSYYRVVLKSGQVFKGIYIEPICFTGIETVRIYQPFQYNEIRIWCRLADELGKLA